MLFHNFKQIGGVFGIGDEDCCDEVFKTVNICDYIGSILNSIVQRVIETPINTLINSLNTVINTINTIIEKIMTLISTVFNFIIEIIKQPIQAINIVTLEIRTIISLILDIMGGDILSIMMVFLLPYIIFYKATLSNIIHVIKVPIGFTINSIIGIFGIKPMITPDVSLYHLLLIFRYLLIMVYLCGVYGFITLVF